MDQYELFDNLIKRIAQYHPAKDLQRVEKAFEIANRAHKDQLRKSGEPYIIHPLAVAYILADLELDLESIIAGILHDVIEDTVYSYDDIVEMFGEETAVIVEGVTKLEEIEIKFKSTAENEGKEDDYDESKAPVAETTKESKEKNYREELQAENYRKMFLAMAKDIRVILIKIADRLHNMRTLSHMRPEKQKEKAQETLDIYSPLAHRLGISTIKNELEDLSFKYLYHDAYYELAEKIKRKQSERIEYIEKIVETVKEKITNEGLSVSVDGRPKHYFSIYKKMINKNKTLDQIFDLFAVRVLVDNVMLCYEVLGIIHAMFTPVPGKFKDYIAIPKPNNYKSLHTVIIGPGGEPVEFQIRTYEMHKTAEYGIAAHWKYKEGNNDTSKVDKEEEKLTWLRQILDWQRELSDNKEFLKALKVDLDVFTEHVYCFSPKGELISLRQGATPIDFAYAIHSAVGNKMVGVRVNGRIVPFEYALCSGDRIEIMTSNNSKGPSKDWLSIVKTSQARNKISQWFKKENKEENILRGKEILEKDSRKRGINLSEILTNERKNLLINRFGFLDWNALCAAIGHGGIREGQILSRLIEDYEKDLLRTAPKLVIEDNEQAIFERNKNKKSGIVIKNLGDTNVRLSQCCSPVPGDEIVGFVTRGRGVSIHRTDCVNILNMDEMERHRFIEAEWQLPDRFTDSVTYQATIKVYSEDRMDLLTDVSRILAEEKIAVKQLNARITNGNAILEIGLLISNRNQFDRVRSRIMSLKGVYDIERSTT